MADRIKRPDFAFSVKSSPLGIWYLTYQHQKDHNRTFSADSCQLSESVWVWFGPALDTFDDGFLRFRSGKKPMAVEERKAAEKQIVNAIRDKLYAKQAERQKAVHKPYSATTVNMFIRNLMTWFKWLVGEGVLLADHKPDLSKLLMPEAKGGHRTILMPDQLDAFINYRPPAHSKNQNRAWAGAMLMVDSGVRIEEMVDLRLADFLFKDGLLIVQHGKGDKERIVNLSSNIIAVMLKYKTRFVTTAIPNPYFFGTFTDGKRISEDNFRRDLKIVLHKAKIGNGPDGKKITPHCFRHTACTAMLVNTGDIHRVKRQMGHADIETTEKYLHLVESFTRSGTDEASALNPNGAFRLHKK